MLVATARTRSVGAAQALTERDKASQASPDLFGREQAAVIEATASRTPAMGADGDGFGRPPAGDEQAETIEPRSTAAERRSWLLRTSRQRPRDQSR